METKNSKFVRLANARTQRALDAIRSIGNLSNRNHYDYSEQEVSEITSALKKELEVLKTRFVQENKTAKFKLTKNIEGEK